MMIADYGTPNGESTPMGSFGENLRREREMRGVSLQEISAATKISVRFLQAMEDEQFSKLPGGVFNRGFIRAYARYLGLDEEHVLAEYQLLARPSPDLDLRRLASTRPEPTRKGSRVPMLTVLVGLAMVAGGYGLYHYSRQALEIPTPTSVAQPAPTAVATSAAAGGQEVTSASGVGAQAGTPVSGSEAAFTQTPLGPTVPPGMTTEPPAPTPGFAAVVPEIPGGLVLQVAATERAWVAIDVDGKTVLQRVLNPNEIQTLNAKESFDITTGNAQGIILTLNGETLKPLGRRGEVKSVRLTHEDLKKNYP